MLEYRVEEGIARLGLKSPPVNVLTIALLDDLLAALRAAAADEGVRVVLIESGLPKVFSAGIDLPALLESGGKAARPLLQRLYLDLWDAQHGLGKPSIAVVEGAARGGGMTLAISCAMIVAGEGASFGYPEIELGLIPAIHFVHLPAIVGRHRAFELLFGARSFGAAEALDLGLVGRLAPPGEAARAALDLGRTLAARPPAAMRTGLRAFMELNDVRAEIAKVVDDFCALAEGPESREGIAAFLERRPPRWPG